MSCHVMSDIPYLLNVLVHFTADTTKFNLCAKCETLMGTQVLILNPHIAKICYIYFAV